MNKIEQRFAMHESLTEAELNALMVAARTDNIGHRAAIVRNDQILSMAQHKLIGMQIVADERE